MLCIKLLAAVLCCQFSVSVESVPVFSVTVDSPAVLPAESPKTVSPDPPSQASLQPSRKYLAMFTASWCGPCQNWKRTVLPQLEAAGYHVELIDMDLPSSHKYRSKVSRYPSFVVCDWNTGKWVSDVTIGGISFETAQQMLGTVSKPKTTVVTVSSVVPVSSIYNGKRGSSHENRSTLINHLLSDSIHAGRRTRATLDAMTDSELDALHDQDHRNVRPMTRRRGLFFRW